MRHAARYWGFVVDGRVDDDGRNWALYNLGLLYSDMARLDEAEKMYQRALKGYKKGPGKERVNKYIPALSTVENLADLFRQTDRIKEAEELYGKALFGVEAVFGRLSGRYRGCGTKWALVCVGKGYETKMNNEVRVQSVLYLSKCYPNPNSIKYPFGASAIVYSLRYGHMQNRLRPLLLKKIVSTDHHIHFWR
jgi:tetratricopeptide (TPR) repeat protein